MSNSDLEKVSSAIIGVVDELSKKIELKLIAARVNPGILRMSKSRIKSDISHFRYQYYALAKLSGMSHSKIGSVLNATSSYSRDKSLPGFRMLKRALSKVLDSESIDILWAAEGGKVTLPLNEITPEKLLEYQTLFESYSTAYEFIK